MATQKDFLAFVLSQLSLLEDITYRSMMGEYILYYKGKIVAYLCDNQCLLKPTKTAISSLKNAPLFPPYPGAKPMILLDIDCSKEDLKALFERIEPELVSPKPKKNKTV